MYQILVGACLLVVGVSGQRHRQFGLSPLDSTTPVPILVDSRRIDLHTGAFVYEYAGGDGSSKFEFRYPNGTVVGNYSFVNELGQLETRQYTAGVHDSGFDETTDPNYVDLGNYEHYRHLEQPYVHDDGSSRRQHFQVPVAQAPRPIHQARPQHTAQPRLPVQTHRAPVQVARAPVQVPRAPVQVPRAPVQNFAATSFQPVHHPVAPVQQSVAHVPVQNLGRPVVQPVHHSPVQVPSLPQVNLHAAPQRHSSQVPVVAPTFNLNSIGAAPAPAHNFAPAPAPVHSQPQILPNPLAPVSQFRSAPVAHQPQPIAQPRHRLDLTQQHGQSRSTSSFLDSIISQFQ